MDFDKELAHVTAAARIEEAMGLIDEVTFELLRTDAFVGVNAREAKRCLWRVHWYLGEKLKEEDE